MASCVVFDAKIATGLNNVAGLQLLTDLSVSSIPFIEVRTMANVNRGLPRTMTSGIVKRSGYANTRWISGLLWLVQFEHLLTTYEGEVTIRTTFNGITYANYNAVLDCGNLSDYTLIYDAKYGQAVQDFVWNFTRLELIP